jgi:chromosome segregation ATPase
VLGYETIQLQQTRLDELPEKIANLESQIETLQASHPSPTKNANPDLNLSLPQTQALLSSRESQMSDLDAQIRAIQSQLPRKQRELERLEGELHPLLNQKKTVVAQAREARQRREEGGLDEMEERGRWYRSSETVLKGALGVDQ